MCCNLSMIFSRASIIATYQPSKVIFALQSSGQHREHSISGFEDPQSIPTFLYFILPPATKFTMNCTVWTLSTVCRFSESSERRNQGNVDLDFFALSERTHWQTLEGWSQWKGSSLRWPLRARRFSELFSALKLRNSSKRSSCWGEFNHRTWKIDVWKENSIQNSRRLILNSLSSRTSVLIQSQDDRFTHCFISSVIFLLVSRTSSESYSLAKVLESKRIAFFAAVETAVGGSLMMGIWGGLQFKVISAAIAEDFRLMPAGFSMGDVAVILVSHGHSSAVNLGTRNRPKDEDCNMSWGHDENRRELSSSTSSQVSISGPQNIDRKR